MARWMVGIDTGGTFTDLVAFDAATGALRIAKVSSVPTDPAQAVMSALGELFASGIKPAEIAMLVHGTTVATNAILEGKGVATGLLITKGFRAIYEARGWAKPDPSVLLDTFYQKPPLLAPQSRTAEITERIDFEGNVVVKLDEKSVREAVKRLKAAGVSACAVCCLFSFVNPRHEERIAAIIAREAPEWRVSLSSRVLPTIREYPRLSTTVIDAYVGPIIERYLVRLAELLERAGIKTPQIFLMQSNGGLMRITIGARFPNQTLLSGPAAGVVAGLDLARTTGRPNLVTLDMGGTSTDISLVTEGRAEETYEGRINGQDIGTPMLSVRTLGAGGGTLAWIGKDGLLKMGPQSAGAVPGPACYGRGGEAPTVTDANFVLGGLGGANLLGGRMTMDKALAENAITKHVARPLGLDLLAAAAGMIRIVNANMAIDLRLAFQSSGQDPRKYALLAFGGAGPLHAASLARDLRIPAVLVPPHPGITSAMGLLQTSVRHVYLQSAVGRLEPFDVKRMNKLFEGLIGRALEDVEAEGFARKAVRLQRQIDMRYPYQGYQLTVDCPSRALEAGDKPELKRSFDEKHRMVYGVNAREEDAELVTFRVIAEIAVPQLGARPIAAGDTDPSTAKIGERPLYDLDARGFRTAAIYDRTKLRAGDRLMGPAIIEQFDSTSVVLAGQSASVDPHGNLVIDTGVAS